MLNKKVLLLSIFLMALLSLSVVSAEEISTDSINLDDSGDDIVSREATQDGSISDDFNIQSDSTESDGINPGSDTNIVSDDENVLTEDDSVGDVQSQIDSTTNVPDEEESLISNHKSKTMLGTYKEISVNKSYQYNDFYHKDMLCTEKKFVEFYPLVIEYNVEGAFYEASAYDAIFWGNDDSQEDNYETFKGHKFKFKVYTGKKYKTYYAKVDDGAYTFTLIPKLSLGKHKVLVYFDGKYMGKSYIKYIKGKPEVIAPVKKVKFRKSTYFKIKLKDYYDNLIKKTKIKVKVYTGKKYKVYKLKTNSKGIAKFNTKKLSVGSHKVVITSLNKYYKISKKSKIIVKKAKAKKKSNLKSITLKVSSNRYHGKDLKNGDTISNFYSTYDGQYSPGIHVEAGYFKYGPDDPRHTKLVKAKAWFKNSYGKVITRTVKRKGTYIKINRISGYSPYKVKVYYKKK